MAGRKGKSAKPVSSQALSKEFFEALEQFEQERGISSEYMIERITAAISAAVRGSNGGNDDVVFRVDSKQNLFEVYLNKKVSEEVKDPNREISILDARRIVPSAQYGDSVGIKLDTRDFGRIAAQTAKQVIRQGIREVEKGQILEEMRSRRQEMVTARVERIDKRNGNLTLRLGKFEMPLLKNEQVEGEVYREGDSIKVFVVDIKDDEHSPRVTISRTHPGLVKRLFELSVPEICDGTVEIKAVSREAGSRTKLAVYSNDENVDPVGACIGMRRSRVNGIVDELGGEKIDIIKYSDDPVEFISNALAPATVLSVDIDPENPKNCHVRVPDSQLSLAIGHRGQNARLAARLTGFKIDIHAESDEIPEPVKAAPVEDTADIADDDIADSILEDAVDEVLEDTAEQPSDEITETAADTAEPETEEQAEEEAEEEAEQDGEQY